jgi:Flp pilus assembly protein TadD
MDALAAGLHDADALVRATAARILEQAPAGDRWRLGSALLKDPVRLVRAWAAVSLAATPPSMLAAEESAALAQATLEAIALQNAVGERPEAHVNLANLYMQQGRMREAETELNVALRLDARHVPALVNLADLCRATAREGDAERYLKTATRIAPDAPEAVHALGLVYVRTKRTAEARPLLKRAYELDPAGDRYGYVYAVFLDAQGRTAEAVRILADVHRARQADRDVLTALVTYEAKLGHWTVATAWAQKLVDLRPDDADARTLLAQIDRGRTRRQP